MEEHVEAFIRCQIALPNQFLHGQGDEQLHKADCREQPQLIPVQSSSGDPFRDCVFELGRMQNFMV
jgi:hypothetical protein